MTALDVIYDLARECLAKRDEFARHGWAMPEMPYEAEVRAMLAQGVRVPTEAGDGLLAAVDAVRLQGLAAGDDAEAWADGFRQGHTAAREALARALAASPAPAPTLDREQGSGPPAKGPFDPDRIRERVARTEYTPLSNDYGDDEP